MKNTEHKKHNILTKRAIASMVLMAFLILTFTCFGVALRFNYAMRSSFKKFALSYTHYAAEYIDGDTIAKYIETNEKDEYYNEVEHMLNTAQKANAPSDPEDSEKRELTYFYVFVPYDDDLVYVWDANNYEGACELGYHEGYMTGGKEAVEKIYIPYKEYNQYKIDNHTTQGKGEDIYITRDETYGFIASSYSPIFDSEGNPVAVVGVDIKMTGVVDTLMKFIIAVVANVLVVLIVSLVFFYLSIKKRLIAPIESINDAAKDMVQNIKDENTTALSVHTGDEIEELADSFNMMHREVLDYIHQNEAITAEKERIVTELSLATKIQANMLPSIFPPFPEKENFDIYASMTPAKEVGGDFYDFFLIDENHLALVIADVSGKGIPAALFMMMSKIFIKNAALDGTSPKEVLETVNNQICANNNEEMFVTVWLGILDLESGILTAANAGHEKPIIKSANGEFELFNDRNGFVVGGMEGVKYKDYEIQLEEGSKLFVYTDGVAEATNENTELFGIERTIEALNTAKDENPEKILEAVKKKVDEFVGEAPQFDDLTMLCFELKKKNGYIAEHWDVMETLAAEDTWQNPNGKF